MPFKFDCMKWGWFFPLNKQFYQFPELIGHFIGGSTINKLNLLFALFSAYKAVCYVEVSSSVAIPREIVHAFIYTLTCIAAWNRIKFSPPSINLSYFTLPPSLASSPYRYFHFVPSFSELCVFSEIYKKCLHALVFLPAVWFWVCLLRCHQVISWYVICRKNSNETVDAGVKCNTEM